MSNRREAKLIIVIVSSVLAVGVVVADNLNGGQHSASEDYILQPSYWVPLSATYERVENGVAVVSYTRHRFADGSTRIDRSDGRNAEIGNRAAGRFFRQHGQAQVWTEHPLREQPAGGNPYLKLDRRAVTMVDASDSRVRAAAQLGIPLTFYQLRPKVANASTSILSPELNLLEIWSARRNGDTTIEERLVHLSLGEPNVALTPSPAAQIIRSNEPHGPGRAVKRPKGPGPVLQKQ